MKRNSRSILQEINNIDAERDRNHVIEGRASNIIHAAINLVEEIYGGYDEIEAVDLHNRLVNSIRHKDPKRFIRGIRKIQESKK